jgi:uncharacterized cupredoxin-like copper-binding protein
MRKLTRRAVAAGTAAVLLLAAGCGNDDDTDGAAAPTGDGEGVSQEVCDSFAEVTRAFGPEPDLSEGAIEALAEDAPAEIRDAAAELASLMDRAFNQEDFEALDGPAFAEAMDSSARYFHERCEVDHRVTVRGVEYAFEGLPSELEAGTVSFLFEVPEGAAEPHELVIVERLDGTDEPIEELLALPDEEIFEKVGWVGVAFVDSPGRASALVVDLAPGSYIVVCNYPVGDGDDSHAEHGMVVEVTVS